MAEHTPALPLPALAAAHKRWWVLAACCLASIAVLLEPPVWVFRPPPVAAFSATWVGYNLLISGTVAVAIAFILAGGALGDIFGRRRVLLIGLGGLLLSNGLLLLSPDPLWFLATRFLAGMSGALVLPLSLTIFSLAFAGDPAAGIRAIAIYVVVTTSAALGAGLFGQIMRDLLDWRGAFAIPSLFALLAVVMALRLVDNSHSHADRRLDAVGHAAWALLVLAFVFGLLNYWAAGRYRGVVVIIALAVGAIGLVLLIWWDYHSPDSLLGQSRIKRSTLAALTVYGVALQIGVVGYLSQLRNALIAVWGYGSVTASLALAPLVGGMLLVLRPASRKRLYRLSLRGSMLVGVGLIAAVCALTALTFGTRSYLWLAVLLVLVGVGNSLGNTAWMGIFVHTIPNDLLGVRSAINTAIGRVGGILAITLTGRLLISGGEADYTRRLLVAGVPPARVSEAVAALNAVLNPASPDAAAVDPAIAARLLAGYQLSYSLAFQQLLLVVAAICALGGLALWLGLPRREQPEG